MSWSHEQVNILIEEYSKHSCLYAVKSKQYTNKHARQSSLEEIKKILVAIRPSVTVNEIKTKFAGLKATFMNEHRKHLRSIHSGMGDDEVYKPNLWYYTKMNFLLDHIEVRPSFDSLSAGSDVFDNNLEEQIDMTQEYIITDEGTLEHVEDESEVQTTSRSSSAGSSYAGIAMPTQKRKKLEGPDSVIQEASSALQTINKAMQLRATNTANNATDQNVALTNFIISKLNRITNDEVHYDTEEKIVMLLYNAIKKCK
ncbi:hypothetical protein RN001_002191 [Aquatica leii]|uniref:MADF domain-containing protein n=1 Tax=Aquatica leii TaxID=1421715 RepID=A0AAN7QAY8_9COLE|nr:hypothetical protein RN001_002191 [Aquatica leii]